MEKNISVEERIKRAEKKDVELIEPKKDTEIIPLGRIEDAF